MSARGRKWLRTGGILVGVALYQLFCQQPTFAEQPFRDSRSPLLTGATLVDHVSQSAGFAVFRGPTAMQAFAVSQRLNIQTARAGLDTQFRLPAVVLFSDIPWPSKLDVTRVLFMRDYNTRMVFLGTFLLGISGGTVGAFMLLRKRALVGDVVSHAALPGIAVAFLVMELQQIGSGKSLPGLLIGAACAGLLGVGCTMVIRRLTHIKEDAALAIVLSIFFGIGVALFTVIQKIPTGNAAGLNQFIFGKAASMVADDVKLIAQASLCVMVVCILFFKEFALLCFDEEYATAQGWPVVRLDAVLMALVVGVTVIGMQSVGLLLVVALLITPAAAARFWTDELRQMTLISAGLGGISALLGVVLSALFPRLAAGAVIVLMGAVLFLVSLFFGTQRGVLKRLLRIRKSRRRVGRHDLLRAMFECVEPNVDEATQPDRRELPRHTVSFNQLLKTRTWTPRRLRQLITAAEHDLVIRLDANGDYRLTKLGADEARRVVRNHRLWETYLIQYAEIAPSHVDRDADQIEHLLEPEILSELNELLEQRYPEMAMPPSPHKMAGKS